jgi:histidine phosphotransfer protein HptB
MTSSKAPIVSSLAAEGGAVLKLLLMFVDRLPEMINEIRALYESASWDEFSSKLHTLKGTAGNFGFLEMTDVAQTIEEMLANERYDDIQMGLFQLDNLQQRISIGMSQYKS